MARHSFTPFLLLLGVAALGWCSIAIGQATSTSCSGYMVYFANGIDNSAQDSLAGAHATQNLIGSTFNGQSIQYGRVFHNQTSVGNIQTVLLQKLQTDPSWNWATGSILSQIVLDAVAGLPLPNSVQQFLPPTLQSQLLSSIDNLSAQAVDANGIPGNSYYDTQVSRDVTQYQGALNQGFQVLVIAHSQGNLYADAAYHQLFANGSNSNLQSSFAVASVATPDVSTVSTYGGSPAYITATNDLVIGAVHLVFPAVLAPTDGNGVFSLTSSAGCLFSKTLPDCSGHEYIRTYLYPDLPYRADVLTMATTLLGSLTPPNSGTGCSGLILQISPSSPSVVTGSTTTLDPSATNASGNPIATPPNLQWTSSNGTVATVASGVVTGVAVGTATITVTDPVSRATSSASLTVIAPNSVNPYAGNFSGWINDVGPVNYEIEALSATSLVFNTNNAGSWYFAATGSGGSYSGPWSGCGGPGTATAVFDGPNFFTATFSAAGCYLPSTSGTFTRTQ